MTQAFRSVRCCCADLHFSYCISVYTLTYLYVCVYVCEDRLLLLYL